MTASVPAEPEYHVWESEPSEAVMDAGVRFWRPHLGQAVLDIGCGEGHMLSALVRAGIRAEGVDLTAALVQRATRKGLKVAQESAADFILREGHRFDTFLMLDFVEHIPFSDLASILEAIPKGSRCIIQTPNVNSIIGHQFYLQVPGHVTPLSPMVLRKMFERVGMTIAASGSLWGGLPWKGIRRRVTMFLLEKIFGVTMLPLLVEGANYYVVGEKRP